MDTPFLVREPARPPRVRVPLRYTRLALILWTASALVVGAMLPGIYERGQASRIRLDSLLCAPMDTMPSLGDHSPDDGPRPRLEV